MWDEVPADQQNGIITGYMITYQSQAENDNGSIPAGPDDRQKELTGLKEYVNYNIIVFASTVKGDGPASVPFIVVKTDQDSKLISFLSFPLMYAILLKDSGNLVNRSQLRKVLFLS